MRKEFRKQNFTLLSIRSNGKMKAEMIFPMSDSYCAIYNGYYVKNNHVHIKGSFEKK